MAGATAAGIVGLPAPAILAETRKPLRLGVLNTFTGINAVPADSNFKGMSLYFERIGWTVAGRKIELLKEDDQFNPQIGLQKARKLVESDRVDLICGPQASNVALALLNFCKESGTFLIVWAGTDAITSANIPTVFRPALSSWQLSTPMAGWVYDNLAKDIVFAAADFAAGHDVVKTFKAAYVPKGGKVIKEIYPPLGTPDYSPYLTDILSLKPAATYNFFTGTDAVRYVQQYEQFGLKGRIPLTGFAPIADGTTLPAQGKAALGVITPQIYIDTLDNAANKSFVAEYRAKYGAYPDTYSEYGLVAAQVVEAAVKALDGDTGDKDKLIKALEAVHFDAPRGPFRFDPATHNPIQTVYITEVVELDGRLTHKVIGTIKDVRDPGTKAD
jgi:branched-chain amino acid transport system substrate-binding protein